MKHYSSNDEIVYEVVVGRNVRENRALLTGLMHLGDGLQVTLDENYFPTFSIAPHPYYEVDVKSFNYRKLMDVMGWNSNDYIYDRMVDLEMIRSGEFPFLGSEREFLGKALDRYKLNYGRKYYMVAYLEALLSTDFPEKCMVAPEAPSGQVPIWHN